MDINSPRMRALMSTSLIIAGKDLPKLFNELPAQVDKGTFDAAKATVADIATSFRRFPTTAENNDDFKGFANHLIDEQLKKMAAANTGSGGFFPNYLALVKTLKGVVADKQPTENIGSIVHAAAAD